MKLLVGLGNPGDKYDLSRHNAGFMVIKELAGRRRLKFKTSRRFNAFTAEGLVKGERCYFILPRTFMNLSGHSVRSVVNWLKIGLDDILLVADEIALPFGTIRIRPKGSDAGHKGLRSVITCLGTNEFSRMRIGIMGLRDVKDCSQYVLSRFTKQEQKALPDILKTSAQACECWVKEGVVAAMNRYNSRRSE